MTISAPSVSARLKQAGFGIVATRNREGIRVSRGIGGRVSVCVDLDRPGEARRTAALLEQWLAATARTLGWAWSKAEGAIGIYTISAIQPLQAPAQLRQPPALAAARAAHPSNPDARRARDTLAARHQADVRFAMLGLQRSISDGATPAQADITAARTALEALIELAGGDQ